MHVFCCLGGLPGLFLITVPRSGMRGSAAEIYIEVMGMNRDPDRPVTTDVPDAAECQMMPRVASSSVFYLFIRQWRVLRTMSLLEPETSGHMKRNWAQAGCSFPPCEMKDALKY